MWSYSKACVRGSQVRPRSGGLRAGPAPAGPPGQAVQPAEEEQEGRAGEPPGHGQAPEGGPETQDGAQRQRRVHRTGEPPLTHSTKCFSPVYPPFNSYIFIIFFISVKSYIVFYCILLYFIYFFKNRKYMSHKHFTAHPVRVCNK